MIFFLMTIAGSIPVLACLILLCFKRDSFSVRFELLLLKMGLFFFLVPIQKLWLSVPEPFYNFVNSLFPLTAPKLDFSLPIIIFSFLFQTATGSGFQNGLPYLSLYGVFFSFSFFAFKYIIIKNQPHSS